MALAPDSLVPLPPGTIIGPWRLLGHVDSGAFGRLYKAELAEQPGSGGYALKLARDPGDGRFEREAHLLSLIRHIGVPRLQDQGVYTDERGRPFPYLVMQFVPGVKLYDWAFMRRLSSRKALSLLAQVARALEAAHVHGVHRDVKGANVLVDARGHATLVDFGACWFPGALPLTEAPVGPGTEPYRSHQILRFRCKHMGSSRERYRPSPDDDLYALGVMGYYLVTGMYPPPATEDPGAGELERSPQERIAPSHEATLHPRLDEIIARLLVEDRQARGTAGALARELEQEAAVLGPEADEPIRPKPWSPFRGLAVEAGVLPSRSFRFKPALALLVPVVSAAGLIALSLLLSRSLAASSARYGGDDGSVDVGSSALSSAEPTAEIDREDPLGVGAKIPSEPFKGQTQPPCRRGEVELNKGCWARAADIQPPCHGYLYEWEGACYWPVMASKRPPTSEP